MRGPVAGRQVRQTVGTTTTRTPQHLSFSFFSVPTVLFVVTLFIFIYFEWSRKKAGTYRPAEGERYDESGVGLVRLDEGERIASQDGAGRVAVGARTGNGHVALILLEAQPEMSGALALAGARTVLSSVPDTSAALAVGQPPVRILQRHHFQLEEARRSGQLHSPKQQMWN